MLKFKGTSLALAAAITALAIGLLVGYLAGRKTTREVDRVASKNTCGPDALSAAPAGPDASGTTMLGLKQAAETLGAKATGLRLSQKELEGYVKQGVGVIAFINGDHYVWVKNTHPQGVVIKDIQPGFQFVPYEKWYSMWLGKTPDAKKGRGVCLIIYPKSEPKA